MNTEIIKWKNDPLLKQLLSTSSPSCREYELTILLKEWLQKHNYQTMETPLGNIIGCINPSSKFKLLLSAHADEIGLQVTKISKEGFLFFRRVGGIEAMSLCGHEVFVLNKKGTVSGVIGRDAQNYNLTENGASFTLSDLWIDIGAENEETAKKIVEIGDFISFKPNFQYIGQNRICSKGIDNKISIFILAKILEIVKKEQLNIGLYVAATTQEEIGLRGIASCANIIKPNIGFVIDTGFATDIPQNSTSNYPDFALGKGTGLIINADNSLPLIDYLTKIAQTSNIPIQKSVGHRLYGGTDAAALRSANNGIPTANISIPCRYMHSHTEIIDWRDVYYTIQLLKNTISQIDKQKDQYPDVYKSTQKI